MAAQTSPPVAEDVWIDDSRYERLDGQLTERPVPGEAHADLQLKVLIALLPFQDTFGGKARQEWSVARGNDWLTPDVTFSYPEFKTNKIGYLIAPAYLCVEVRSPTQQLSALFRKREIYHRWGTKYCWIVDPLEKACYECTSDTAGHESVVVQPDILHAGSVEIPLASLWAA